MVSCIPEKKNLNLLKRGGDIKMEIERNIRSFGKIIGLSIITLGIYFWVYLFKTLSEMEKAFTFTSQELALRKVRVFLIVYLITSIILAIVGIGFRNCLENVCCLEISSGWKIISNIILAILSIVFWVSFVKLIEVCQIKREITPLSKEIIWILLTVIVVLPFASIIGTNTGTNIGTKVLSLLNISVSLVFLYMIVKQINRIWKGQIEKTTNNLSDEIK